VKDTVAPEAPVLDVANSSTGTSTGTVVGTGTKEDPIVVAADGKIDIKVDADTEWRYSVDGGLNWVQGTPDGIPSANLAEGNNTIQIVQVDKAGNISPPKQIEIVKDTVAPEAPVLDVANSSTGTSTGTVVGTGTKEDPIVVAANGNVNIATDIDGEWRYSTDGGQTWKPGAAAGISAKDLVEGDNTILIVQVDKAGNASAPTSITVVKDTVAPEVPVLDLTGSVTGDHIGAVVGTGTPEDPILLGATGNLSFATDPDSSWNYSTDGGQTWKSGSAAGISADDLAEGNNSIQIVQVDRAGNMSDPTTIEVVKDTVAPTAPVTQVTAVSGTGTESDPIRMTANGSISIGTDADAQWLYSKDNGQTWLKGSGTSLTAAQLSEGSNSLQIIQLDSAGNASDPVNLTVVKDTTAAKLAVTFTQVLGYDSGNRPVVEPGGTLTFGNLEPGAKVQIWGNGYAVDYTTDSSIVVGSKFSYGYHGMEFRQVDALGNASGWTSIAFVMGWSGVVTPIVTVQVDTNPAGDCVGQGTTDDPYYVATGGLIEVGQATISSYRYSIDGGSTWKQGPAGGIQATELAEGKNTLQLVQTDSKGNVSAPVTITVVKDTIAQDLTVSLTQVAGYDASGQPVVAEGSGAELKFGNLENGGKVQYSLSATGPWIDVGSSDSQSLDALLSQHGATQLYFRQLDVFGNVGNETQLNLDYVATGTAADYVTSDLLSIHVTATSTGNTVGTGTQADPYYMGNGGLIEIGHGTASGFLFSTDGGQTWTQGTGTGITASALAEGSNTLQVIQIDSNGNASQPGTITVVKDSTAAALQVSLTQVAGYDENFLAVVVDGDGSVFKFGNLEAGAKVQYSWYNQAPWYDLPTTDGIGAGDLGSGGGLKHYYFRQVDQFGNASEGTEIVFQLERSWTDQTYVTYPSLAIDVTTNAQGDVLGTGTESNPYYVAGSGAIDIGQGGFAAGYLYSLDNGQTWVQGTGSVIHADALVEGTNTLQIIQIDNNGSTSKPETITVIKDTMAEKLSVTLTGLAGFDADGVPIFDLANAGGQFHFNNLEAGAHIELSNGDQSAWMNLGTSETIDIASFPWSNFGKDDVLLRQVDASGNVGETIHFTFWVDNSGTNTTVVTPGTTYSPLGI
ncbi:hypothetical protein CDN98_20425, partial [Roseateles terrae]